MDNLSQSEEFKVYVDFYRVLGTGTSIQTARFSNTKSLHLIDHNREAARVIPAGTMLFGTTNKVVKTDFDLVCNILIIIGLLQDKIYDRQAQKQIC